MKFGFRKRLLATSLLVGAATLAVSPAFAETAPTPADEQQATAPAEEEAPPSGSEDDTEGEERLAPPDSERAADIATALAALAEERPIRPDSIFSTADSGDTEDVINSWPFVFSAQGANVNNGATGTANVNLRGLGTQRTLVLINGRRIQPGDPRAPFTDLNFVPRQMIKRIDYLTGGASAVYGSDAVAGIVNFIMDTRFRGLRVDAQASVYMHDNDASDAIIGGNFAANRGFRPPRGMSTNGGAQDIAVSFGAGFDDDRGSIVAYATYRKQDTVSQASRDYSLCSLAARSAAQGGLGSGTNGSSFNCGDSATSANGTFFTNVGTFQVQGNQFVPGSTPFNFAPYNFYQRPDERYTLGAFAEYEIGSGAKPYLEAMFMDDQTHSQIPPSGDFFNTTTINCDNPLLSTQQFNTICVPSNTFVDSQAVTRAIFYAGRRNVEGGAREVHLEHTAYRIVGGIRGTPLNGVTYDAYYQFGTTRLSQVLLNDMSVPRLRMALDVVANPAVGGVPGVPAGTPVCRIRLTDPGNLVGQSCAPWNIFTTGGVTPEALAFLQIPLLLRGHVNQTVADANVTLDGGEYGIRAPWSDRGIGLNVGFEYRKEALETTPDMAFQLAETAGQGAPVMPIEGDFDVREAFAEIQLPVVTHSFIEELTLSAGYRYSDYKVANHHFNTNTYKLGVELVPVSDIRFRGSYNRAVRAPNLVELFTPQTVGIGGTVDPCAGAAPAATAAQCALTGVSAAQYGTIAANPANQYNALFGGNPNLAPEESDSYTVGVVLQPRFIPGLAFSVDYFDIKVRRVVSTLGFQSIMTQCLVNGDPFLCSKIHRAPGTGSLWLSDGGFIDITNLNIGGLRTKGFDLNGSYYRLIGGAGTLTLSYNSTFLRELEVDTGVVSPSGEDGKFDCAGLYGNTCGAFLTSGAPNPKYRHRLRVGFALPNGLGITGQWRYFSSVRNDGLEEDCDISATPTCTFSVSPANAKIHAQSYFDMALLARLGDRYNFRLGANNIFDRQPPVVGGEVSNASFGSGNTFPQFYDAMGRYVFAGVTVDF
jgi:outer membrane receptor protein involved in Fe transport